MSCMYSTKTTNVTSRLKIETESWARSGVITTVGSSYVLEPGQAVQTRLYDGKLYTLTSHSQGDSLVRIVQTPGDTNIPETVSQ